MTGRELWHVVRRVWITLGITATVIFVSWSLIAFRASAAARGAVLTDASVAVRHHDGVWTFAPMQIPAADVPRLVFFPGALVDPRAYAPLLRAVAAAGFPVYMVELPRRGAFGGAESDELWSRLRTVVESRESPQRWLAAGHSRGGVVASQVASERWKGFDGLILIGTSHPRDVNLSALSVPVTKIVGTRDGLASRAEVEQNRELLPAATRWVWIEGGNHSQFGWYGFQPGDRRATISAAEQRGAMISAVLEALSNVQQTTRSSVRS